jgi:uncharacterized cupin superfamily protein
MPVPFEHASVAVPLQPSPIVPAWVREGDPVARAAEISRSADGTAFTVVWECTAGKFDWTYDFDETIHIIEGSVVLQDGGNPPTRLGPGAVVFFPKGSQVSWEVEGYVKKVAFFRKVIPNPLSGPYKLLRRLKQAVRGTAAAPAGLIGQSA